MFLSGSGGLFPMEEWRITSKATPCNDQKDKHARYYSAAKAPLKSNRWSAMAVNRLHGLTRP